MMQPRAQSRFAATAAPKELGAVVLSKIPEIILISIAKCLGEAPREIVGPTTSPWLKYNIARLNLRNLSTIES